jgi:hypothetical protein
MSLCDVISKLSLAIHATVHAPIINTETVITPCKFTGDVMAIFYFVFLRKTSPKIVVPTVSDEIQGFNVRRKDFNIEPLGIKDFHRD